MFKNMKPMMIKFNQKDILYPNKPNTVIMFYHSNRRSIELKQEMYQVIILKDGWAYNVENEEHSFPVYKEMYHFWELDIKTGKMIKLDLSDVSPSLCTPN